MHTPVMMVLLFLGSRRNDFIIRMTIEYTAAELLESLAVILIVLLE